MAREELYKAFGPMLLEAQSLVILDQLNVIRAHVGLPGLTPSQIVTALENKLANITPYAWMADQ